MFRGIFIAITMTELIDDQTLFFYCYFRLYFITILVVILTYVIYVLRMKVS